MKITKYLHSTILPVFVLCCPFMFASKHSDISNLEGKEVDIALSAYHYYADCKNNPAETKWITEGQEGVLGGLVWEELRPVSRIVVKWDKDDKTAEIPALQDLIVEKFISYDHLTSWWQGQWEPHSAKTTVLNEGGTIIFEFEKPMRIYMLRIRHRLKANIGGISIPEISAYDVRPLEWKLKELSICRAAGKQAAEKHIKTKIKAYNGIVSEGFSADIPGNIEGMSGINICVLTAIQKEITRPIVFIHGKSNSIHKAFHFLYKPMRMNDTIYYKGVSTTPPARLTVYHPEKIISIRSSFGIDWNHHTLGKMSGSAIFRVVADGKEFYNSGVVHVADSPRSIDIKFEPTDKIDLIIEKGASDTLHNHSDWTNIYFTTLNGREICLDELQWVEYPLDKTDNYRTVITVESEKDSFSFLPADVSIKKPVYFPDYKVVIKEGENTLTKQGLDRIINSSSHRTVRQRVASMSEQNWKNAMEAIHGRTDLPEIPEPNSKPPCTISVPENELVRQWNLSAENQKNHVMKTEDGNTLILCYPYTALAQESYLTVRALDYLGYHEIARGGLNYWLKRQGEAKPAGQFYDKAGCLTLDNFMDEIHGIGAGAVLWNIAQHYRLTGDTQWLESIKTKIIAAGEWMHRQAHYWTKNSGGYGNPWFEGLMPPAHIGDISEHRMWYKLHAFYYAGLSECAEVLKDIDRDASKQMLEQAEELKKAILKAVDKSVKLSPARKTGSGVYRHVIPTATHIRGLAYDIVPQSGMGHGGPLWGDVEFGSLSLVTCGVLSPFDNKVEGFLDVIEDNLLIHNKRLSARKSPYDPEKNWFERGGVHYQNGYMETAMIYLMRDEIENFLRIFYNQMASVLVPGPYTFEEHTGGGLVVQNKIFEESAFLERLRNMLVMEADDRLWVCRGAPRSWLNDGEMIKVENAPTYYGNISFKIISKLDNNTIQCSLNVPERIESTDIVIRLRHPDKKCIASVMVNGQKWRNFGFEDVILNNPANNVFLEVRY